MAVVWKTVMLFLLLGTVATHGQDVPVTTDPTSAELIAELRDEQSRLRAELQAMQQRLKDLEERRHSDDLKEIHTTLKNLESLATQQNAQMRAVLTMVPSAPASPKAAADGARVAPPSRSPVQPSRRGPDTTIYDVKVGFSPTKGPEDAKVTIVAFSDFECGYCSREFPKLNELMKTYSKEVRLVYKHTPLPFHPRARPAHAAAMMAHQELGDDGFWKFHDLVLSNPGRLSVPDLRKHAETLGLDLAAFDRLMANDKTIFAMIRPDLKEAEQCKVQGTPTILINGRKLANRSLTGYKARIDEILKDAG